jgi:hypothetical protein
MSEKIKGYKVFDENWKCYEYQYSLGGRFKHEGEIKLCVSGFHFCEKLIDCFNYKKFKPENKVAEIIAHGKVIRGDDKSVTDDIEIIKEISWEECLEMVNSGSQNSGLGNSGHFNSGNRNSGHYNSGDRNSGNRNSGYSNSGRYNSGHYNSGHYNSGDYNSGDYNTGDYNSGHYNSTNFSSGLFNTEEQKMLIFDKPSSFTMETWFESKFSTLFDDLLPFKWVYDNEKQQGYWKEFTYKEMWREWWKTKTNEEKELLKEIPNFDPEKFRHITGIDVSKD